MKECSHPERNSQGFCIVCATARFRKQQERQLSRGGYSYRKSWTKGSRKHYREGSEPTLGADTEALPIVAVENQGYQSIIEHKRGNTINDKEHQATIDFVAGRVYGVTLDEYLEALDIRKQPKVKPPKVKPTGKCFECKQPIASETHLCPTCLDAAVKLLQEMS